MSTMSNLADTTGCVEYYSHYKPWQSLPPIMQSPLSPTWPSQKEEHITSPQPQPQAPVPVNLIPPSAIDNLGATTHLDIGPKVHG
jgi:hypothetical protein